jgi:hypothetical protein
MVRMGKLDRINEARNQLSRIIRSYSRGDLDRVKYRDLVYGLSALLAFQRAELDQELEKRLDAIEEKLK